MAQEEPAFRGLWVVRESITKPSEVDAALEFATSAGFNHVFVQIRGRGDAYYRSLLVPRSSRIPDPAFDPLEYAVRRGHELGLNIHAWVTTYLIWSARSKPARDRHIYNLHPEWLEVTATGSEQRKIDLSAPRDKSFEGIYLAPTHPQVNNYLQAVFTEILLHYDIDGLHLDYVRFADADYGYNAEGLREFQAQYNYNPLERAADLVHTGSLSASAVADLNGDWDRYRRDRITSLVTALHAIITISGREIMLSAAVKPNPRIAKNKYYQDWVQWLKDGILDYAVLMNYTPVTADYHMNLGVVIDDVPAKLRKKVIVGVANYNQTPHETAGKIKLARVADVGGIAVFSYDAFKTDLRRFDPIIKALRE